jgi:hypothetical protein
MERKRIELVQREVVEQHIIQNKHVYARPKRAVTILKKNVYGYWEDPMFNGTKPLRKKPYQRYLDKYTQTTW